MHIIAIIFLSALLVFLFGFRYRLSKTRLHPNAELLISEMEKL